MSGDMSGETGGDTGDVIVVGSGVIGLTTAVVLAGRGHRVRVWTREPAAETTSAVAGALWWPYRIEPEGLVGAWSLTSLRVYGELAGPRTGETGVRLVPGVEAGSRLDELGAWARQVPGLRELEPGEVPGGYRHGLAATLPLIDMPVHLAWLRARLEAAGGTVESREVRSLDEAAAAVEAGAGAVVNCTGLGARDLVPDPDVVPVRGQLVLVENPGIESWFAAADKASSTSTYFFPQPGRLVLGGTAEEGDRSPEADPATAAAIVERCARIRPEIADARVLGHRVGLRPVRVKGVRLERAPGGARLLHNYGHGGAGVTVAWGCAYAVASLLA
ncbi:FAD-dependent oxidoreductase [Streptomyces formicae]|uniref:D-amino-acid oxidase n=1 Tax=Streptomyces formicae TaxID=1616117 RepID=A0ABY3WM94_9ACTN|nr:FAD-dependent oxidoreductase [Streptomyces formicae]UNM12579.1 FAD-dependent oxidoreductase [Streptomyces formicae]